MNKIKTLKRALVITLVACLSMIFNVNNYSGIALAADVPDYRLQISPTQANVGELQPGRTYHGSFKVQNSGQKAYAFETDIKPYSVKSGDYTPSFSEENKYSIMQEWVTVEGGTGTVEPGAQVEVKYHIKVPNDAPAGNQNAAITVSMTDDESPTDTGVKTIQQVAFVIFSNIAGETRETAEILDNKIPGFLFEPPVTATSTVKNTGNVYTAATYKLEVSSFFGGKNVYTTPEEKQQQVIFPETERYNEVSWDDAPQLGIFKVKQTITIFDETSTVEKTVFLCPIWFLVIVIVFVAVAVFWIVSRVLKRKQG